MWWIALAVAVVSLIASIWLRRRMTRPPAAILARAALVRSTKPYAEAKPGELAKVGGIVKASDKGLVEGPMSKVPSVWFQIEVTEDRGDESFAPLTTVGEWLPFLVDGARITSAFTPIGPTHGRAWSSSGLRTTSSGPVVEASPAVGEFLERHGKKMESKDGFARRREYTETRIEPGQHVFVLGLRSAARAQSQSSGYRDGEILVEDEIKPQLVVLGTEDDVLGAARQKFGVVDALVTACMFTAVFPMLLLLFAAFLDAIGYPTSID